MRYVIYGAGAIGGVVGGLLHRAGLYVTLVARGAHLEAIRTGGLAVETADGLLTCDVPATGSAREIAMAGDVGWTDDTVVLLCVKSQQTEAALADLTAYMPTETPIVAVQNGVANETRLLRAFPNVYGMHVVLPATHLEPGLVVLDAATVPGVLDVGRFPSGADGTAAAIADDLRKAGFASQARADIMAWKYRKLISNLGNGVDAIAGSSPEAAELARLARAEGEEVLAVAGIAVASAADDKELRRDLTSRAGSGGGSSTWQSLARGSDVEIDFLAGEIVLLGRLHDTPTPVNELIQATVHEVARRGLPAGSLNAADLLGRLDPLHGRRE